MQNPQGATGLGALYVQVFKDKWGNYVEESLQNIFSY